MRAFGRESSVATMRAGRWLLAATVAGAALAVGTVHTITLCVVVVALAIAALLTTWDPEPIRPRPAATLLLATAVVLTAYTGLQCIPLPMPLVAAVAPHNADVWSRVFAPLHAPGPRWAPLSVDPTATRVELLKGCAYLLAFLTALRVARSRDGTAFLGGAIIITGLALATAALLHPAFGAHKLYGVWTPSMNFGRHLAPFLNPNNLAAYLNLAFCLAFAAALAPEPRIARPILAACALTLAATQIWVASRGGTLAMLVGATLVIAIARAGRARRGTRAFVSASLIVGIAAAAGTFLIVVGQSENVAAELFDSETTKLHLLLEAMKMSSSYPIFGTGRGAFETTFPAFRQTIGYAVVQYPENVIAQWVIEWGIPVGVGGLAAIAFGLRPNSVLARSSTAAGAWAGMAAVALQNLVDLGSEIPGLMLSCAVCAAIVVGGVGGRDARSKIERWAAQPRLMAIASSVVAALGIAGAAYGVGRELNDDRKALYDSLVAGQSTGADGLTAVRAAMLRHPAEPYLPMVAAMHELQERDGRPLPWIEATLERATVYGPAHLLLARALSRRSPSQARLEYRLAMEQAYELHPTAIAEVPQLIRSYDDAREVVPVGQAASRWVLERLVAVLEARLPATCVRLDEDHQAGTPTDFGPLARSTTAVVEDLEAGAAAPWCNGDRRGQCLRGALDGAERAVRIAPDRCEPRLLRARARVAVGEVSGGLEDLVRATESLSDTEEQARCIKGLEQLAVAFHDEAYAATAIAKLANMSCAEAEECAGNLAWAATAEEARGNAQRALVFYRRAFERAPDLDAALEGIARLAASAGLHAEAAESYERLSRKHPTDRTWKTAAEKEHTAATKSALSL